MMDKTDKVLNMLSKPEPAMVVPIGSDVVIPNLSGIKGNKDAMNKLTLQTVTDNGATTTQTIILSNDATSECLKVLVGANRTALLENNGTTGRFHLYSSDTERVRINSTTDGYYNNGFAFGQSAGPASTSILELVSTARGFLPPRMTTAQKNAITSPATGLMVYDTNLNKLCVYTGAAWETITSA